MDRLYALRDSAILGAPLTEEDHDFLRGLGEVIDDIEDIQFGSDSGAAASEFGPAERAEGPALAIVVGHTSIAKGASGHAVGEPEYLWNSDLAAKVMDHCQVLNVEAKVFLRDGVGISGAYANVLAYGANCVVELHFNSFNGTVHGTETLYDAETNEGSEAWARELQDAMVELYERSGAADRGLKERDHGDRGYASVSAIDIPTALIEPFFGDNTDDGELGNQLKDDLALSIARTAANRLNAGM